MIGDLRKAVQELAECDDALAQTANAQSEIVVYTRLALGAMESLLLVAAYIESCFYASSSPILGWYFSAMIATGAVGNLLAMYATFGDGLSNWMKRRAYSAADTYASSVRSLPNPALVRSACANAPATQETTITDFEALKISVSAMPAPAEKTTASRHAAKPSTYTFADLYLTKQIPEPAQRPTPMVQLNRPPGTPTQRSRTEQAVPAKAAMAEATQAGAGTRAADGRAPLKPLKAAMAGPKQGDSPWKI